jgi:hypothetical protein
MNNEKRNKLSPFNKKLKYACSHSPEGGQDACGKGDRGSILKGSDGLSFRVTFPKLIFCSIWVLTRCGRADHSRGSFGCAKNKDTSSTAVIRGALLIVSGAVFTSGNFSSSELI